MYIYTLYIHARAAQRGGSRQNCGNGARAAARERPLRRGDTRERETTPHY